MVDLFQRLYNSTFRWGRVASALKLPKIARFFLRETANFVLPVFLMRGGVWGHHGKCEREVNYTVSLTSFPKRIARVHLVVQTLKCQSVQPKGIILWLSKDQFPSETHLPSELVAMQDSQFSIRFVDGDLRSYKKYYYLKDIPFGDGFIIVDDDIFYPSYLIKDLVETAEANKRSVTANRSVVINLGEKYASWAKPEAAVKRFDLFPTGCGGVLYPKDILDSRAFDKELFLTICPDADDIWLNVCAFIGGASFVDTCVYDYSLQIKNRNDSSLHATNVTQGLNDDKMLRTRDYFMKKSGVDVFERSTFSRLKPE